MKEAGSSARAHDCQAAVSWSASREHSFAEKRKMAASRWSRRARLTAFIAFLFALFSTGSSTAQVPLLIWSNDGLPSLASPAAGHITSNEQLSAYLTSAFGHGPHTVLLFLQDKLSKDDFTVFGGVFGNKQDGAFKNLEAALQSSSSSVTLPALEWSDSSVVLALLQEKLGVSPLLVDADTLSHLNINTSASNLLLINLPYCTGVDKPCKEVLHNNDEIIGKVLSVMKDKNVLYTAIYTGLRPSRVISETSMSHQHAGRTLLQAPAPDVKPPIMFNVSGNPCIMLWAQNLNVSVTEKDSQWIDLAAQTPSLAGSMCNTTNSLLVLSYASGFTLSFSMSQRFYSVSARNWSTLDSVQLQSNGTTATFLGGRNTSTPAEYSFHCQSVTSHKDPLLVLNTTNPNISEWKLNFVDFQIQGFGLANGTNFSYASDCAGFFTPGIWMGLLTSLLMLLIFVYGLHMIMQLNTMDRFDDPKAPVQRVFFGSSQERRLFPLHYAPDRLGNQMSRQEAPHLGPGCYDNHEFGSMLYDLEKTPGSKKGYGLSARTAVRFPPCNKTATPSPQQYQQDQSWSRVAPPGKTPFNSTTQRFKSTSCTAEDSPGPGTYTHDAVTNRKVSWPMCFGRPDRSRMPQMEKKSFRVKLNSEKEFLKHSSRVAYLSLYY